MESSAVFSVSAGDQASFRMSEGRRFERRHVPGRQKPSSAAMRITRSDKTADFSTHLGRSPPTGC